MTTLDWKKATALVHDAQRVLVVAHVGPDGDAFGSLLGLAHALRRLGKDVITALDGGVYPEFMFLPGAEDVHAALDSVDVDLTIAVDCGDESRMGKVGQVARATGKPLINLDHHRTNTRFGDANLVDERTVAAAEGVLDWLPRLGVELDAEIALCLLTGLVTDTLCFRTDNVTSDTLGKAQQLMSFGASLSDIVQRTVNHRPYAGIRLWSVVMPTVQMAEHVMWAEITQEMFQQAEYDGFDDAGLVSMLVQTEGVYIAVVLREKPDGSVELGIRAVPGYDTSKVAVALGGGGHPAASGATVHEPLDVVVPRAVKMLQDVVRNGKW
ncbi:MAG: bifunctional oligoribonuclease/PAP phosphatase NrnA [Anaerolineae bacterium]|nr:bifunctional oligoribonuclease/PAP phosphatase NrnA [Anaerolineae bacterium]